MKTVRELSLQSRSATRICLMGGLALQYGLSLSDAFAESDVDPSAAIDNNAHISAFQDLSVATNLCRHLLADVPELGILAGSSLRLSTLGIWGAGLSQCANLRETFRFAARFSNPAHDFMEATIYKEGHRRVMRLSLVSMASPLRRFIWERELFGTLKLLYELAGSSSIVDVLELPIAKPSYHDVIERCAQAQIRYQAGRTAIVFKSDAIFRRLAPNNVTTRPPEHLLDAAGGKPDRDLPPLKHRVGAVILGWCTFGMEEVASHLGMTARTMHRKLDSENSSYRQIIADLRVRLADEQLATTRRSVEQIASTLGYRNATNFIRAYKRTTGKTPGRSVSHRPSRGTGTQRRVAFSSPVSQGT